MQSKSFKTEFIGTLFKFCVQKAMLKNQLKRMYFPTNL